MPVIRDAEGKVYRIPSSALSQYELSDEQIKELPEEVVASLQGDDGDVELQSLQMPRAPSVASQWYSGD